MFRSNLTENQKGVPLHLDVLVLEHSTCKPVTDQFVEIWGTNSTVSANLELVTQLLSSADRYQQGIYGNVNSRMNGNIADTKNLDNTMLRGFQQTDKDGVVAFDTLVPGHYPIRANHVHSK